MLIVFVNYLLFFPQGFGTDARKDGEEEQQMALLAETWLPESGDSAHPHAAIHTIV